MSIAYAQKVSSEQPFSAEDRFQAPASVQIAPTSSPPRAVLIDIVGPLAVCVAPAGNREQTQIASGLTTVLVFELSVSEMQPNNDENLPKLGRTPLNQPVLGERLGVWSVLLYSRGVGRRALSQTPP